MGEVTVGDTVVVEEDIPEEAIEAEVWVIAAALTEEVLVVAADKLAVAIAEAVPQHTVDMAIAVLDARVMVEDPEGTTTEDMHQGEPYTELL
jgi:fructose-specific component phosphotransferase system IIB-like protein